jgi:hypothetical protein
MIRGGKGGEASLLKENKPVPFAESDGIRIYYDDSGEGEPVLLCLPGWCNTHTIFAPLAERLSAIQAVQYYDRWREGAEQLLTMWLSGAPASVETEIRNQMLRQGYEMWSRAAREILAMYALEGDPLRALSKFNPPVSVLHVYAQPRAPEFLSAQESFAREHPWFVVRRLEEAVSQFPTLEVPEETAGAIREFIR